MASPNRSTPRTRRVSLSLLLATIGLVLSVANPASASPIKEFFDDLPGISLRRLVEGGGQFDSQNGDLTFGHFSAEVSGHALRNLDFYRVIRLDDGFRLYAPMIALFGSDAQVELGYSVEAADGQQIDAISLSFLGGAIFGGTQTRLSAFDRGGDELATLRVFNTGIFGRNVHADHSRLGEAVNALLVDETIEVRSGLFSLAWRVDHRFRTAPIPEPTTALLLGLGMAGLAFAGRSGDRAI